MAALLPQCRGFSHPVVLLLRTSASPARQRLSAFTTSTRIASRAKQARSFATGSCLHKKHGKPKSGPPPGFPIKAKPGPPPGFPVKAKPGPSDKNVTKSSPPSDSLASGPTAYAQLLASKPHGAVLYEVGPKTIFVFSSYLAATFTFAAAFVNLQYNVFSPPTGVPFYVPIGLGAAGVVLAGFGTMFALKPTNMIRSIRVLPSAAAGVTGAGAPAARRLPSTPSPVKIEVVARSRVPLPFLPLEKVVVHPHEIVMKSRMYNPDPLPKTPEQELRDKQTEEERKEAGRQYERNHLLSAPFRHSFRVLKTIAQSFRRGLTGEGFAPVIIKEQRYKLDITDAYALDDGKALDRLVKIEEDMALLNLYRK